MFCKFQSLILLHVFPPVGDQPARLNRSLTSVMPHRALLLDMAFITSSKSCRTLRSSPRCFRAMSTVMASTARSVPYEALPEAAIIRRAAHTTRLVRGKVCAAFDVVTAAHLPRSREHDRLEVVIRPLTVSFSLELTLFPGFEHGRAARYKLVTCSDAAAEPIGIATRLHLCAWWRINTATQADTAA